MKGTRLRTALAMLGAILALIAYIRPPAANAAPAMTLYQDPKTGALYATPGHGRLYFGTFVPQGVMERQIQQKTQSQIDAEQAQMRAEFEQKTAQQQQWNAQMAQQVSEMQPAWREFGDRWYKKISIGTLVYADYRYYTHTGFGPQFLTQQTWPGVGNNGFNAFDITRAYLDFKFTPTEDISARVTPNIYETIGTSQPDKVGTNTAWAQTSDGDLTFRLKYAYLDYNTFFTKVLDVSAMHGDKITFGQQQNPLVDWEENLWGFRYTALTPWNYLSLSSTQVGLSVKGPIKFNEMQYADYDVGVYDDASFHAIEQSSYKQVMGRLTINPLGARSRYDSLGITGFWDYGYPNKAEDGQTGTGNASAYGHMTRVAGLLHYTADSWGLIGEFDYGHNAFSENNFFSGSGPIDAFSTSFTPTSITCKPITITKVPTTVTPSCSPVFPSTSYGPFAKMVGIYQNASTSVQLGWDFMGHYDIPETPFTLFGLYQQLNPNQQVTRNPLDFYRYDLGLQWLINKYLRVAFTAQTITYHHSQFNATPAQYLSDFTTFGKKNAPFTVTDAVPRDTHMFMINLEFRY
jgi:hypothetical protein